VLSILFLFMVYRVIEKGPETAGGSKQNDSASEFFHEPG
jgi:hypothetical protein